MNRYFKRRITRENINFEDAEFKCVLRINDLIVYLMFEWDKLKTQIQLILFFTIKVKHFWDDKNG